MFRFIIAAILLSFNSHSFGQDNYPKIYFELGYNFQNFKMNNFNDNFVKLFTSENGYKSEDYYLFNEIKHGNSYQLFTSLKLNDLIELGIGGFFQSRVITGRPIYSSYDDNGNIINTTEGLNKISVRTSGFGVKGTFYFNQLYNPNNKNFKFNYGIELYGGIGFSTIMSEGHYTLSNPVSISNSVWNSQDFQSQIGLNFEYELSKTPFLTTIGIRGGYQFFKTDTLKNRLNEKWESSFNKGEPINLDFSGFYYGIYLKIGK